MNEVEKMYRNSGIEKHKKTMLDIETGKNVLTLDSFYPEFTAEKQLELIKWLGSIKDYIVEIDKFKGVYYVGCREAGSNNKHWGSHNLFEEALAELINDLWQDLTEVEHTQIKEVLSE